MNTMQLGIPTGVKFLGAPLPDLPSPIVNTFVISNYDPGNNQGQLTWTVTVGNAAIGHVVVQQSDDNNIDWLDVDSFTNPCNQTNYFANLLSDGPYWRLKVYGDGILRAVGPVISGTLNFYFKNQQEETFTRQDGQQYIPTLG